MDHLTEVAALARGTLPPLLDLGAVPDLTPVTTPTVRVALPDGSQAQIPGVLWPNPNIWAASERRARAGAPPAIEVRRLSRRESNPLCDAWHPYGAETRPFGRHAFALFVENEPIALATAGSAHSSRVDQEIGLARANTIELTRLCRSPERKAAGSLRVILRLWRDFLAARYWTSFEETEKVALISYSLPGKAGHVYDHDGWWRARSCRQWGGGATWSSAPREGKAPEALWVYWIGGNVPEHLRAAVNRRKLENKLLAIGHSPAEARALAKAAA